jgi:adenosylcobinamide-phosphate synthase
VTAGGAAAAAGWLADQLVGEPPARAHPVVWFGRLMRAVEARTYADDRARGVAHLAVGAGTGWLAGLVTRRLVGATAATAVATAVCVAGRMLAREAAEVVDAVERGDLDAARRRLPALVGRDPTGLDPPEILRAVVESVAENTVDAVVAPVVWAALGGAPAVLAHRAVNTLDAMVGHRTERYDRFGWASARADDVANWLPARVAAAGVVVLVPSRRREIRRAIREDAPRHPSPNGGVIEAAAAGALGVQLGGRNRYGDRIEDRGLLGRGGPPTADDARRAIALMRRLGGLVATAAAAGSLAGWILRRGPGRGSPG